MIPDVVMIQAIKEVVLAINSSLAASIVAKVTVITALALFAVWLARGSRAAVLHALLAAAFGVMLLLPLASVLVPPVHLAAPVAVENQASGMPRLTPPVLLTDDPGNRAIPVPQSWKISLPNLLFSGWIAGCAICLLPLVIGLWQVCLLRRSGLPWRRGQSLAEAIALDAGVRRRIEVLLHETVPGPMTCGIVYPAIVLPQDAESWNEEDLNRAFVHELEHVRRCDSVSRCLARAACAVYWFHPLVWIAGRKLALEAERACDDAVLRRSEATAYADQLVGLAKRLSVAQKPGAQRSPLLAMANRADLATRVRAVLDARQQRGRAGTTLVAFAFAAAAVLVVAISPLRIIAAPQGTSSPSTRNAQKFEVASVRLENLNSTVNTNDPGFRTVPTAFPSNRLTMRHTGLQSLISESYGVQYNYVLGGPDWLARQHYDLDAKVEGSAGLTREQMRPLLQNLLEERFHLKAHRERKIDPGYALVIAKGGAKLKPNTGAPFGGMNAGFEFKFQNASPKLIAQLVESTIKQPVADRTGLGGTYDFHLIFTREDNPTDVPHQDFGNIFTAIQEQLGLRLVPEKISVDTLVIDHVDRVPTEN